MSRSTSWNPSATTSISLRSAESAADRKSTRLNSSHGYISYAVFCLEKKINIAAPMAQSGVLGHLLLALAPRAVLARHLYAGVLELRAGAGVAGSSHLVGSFATRSSG